jgi:transcriptional regulator with XRE-family HTH domain
MVIGDRLRDIRKQKNFSQGEMEKRTGLFRCYISRVENGHTVPAIETLEKIARAFEVPMYQLFYDAERPLDLAAITPRKTRKDEWGSSRKDARLFCKLQSLLGQMDWRDRRLLLAFARKVAQRGREH